MAKKLQQQRRLLLKGIAASAITPWAVKADTIANPDVVIVGAGIAGLEAAKTLHKKGVSFLIVEANNRIGGRIHTNNKIFGVPFDTHAHWMRASPTNLSLIHI